MTLYLSFCASETDIMTCAACKIMKKGCKDDCCFAEFFPPQDTAIYKELKLHFSFKFMRTVLSDTTTKEDKKERVQERVFYMCRMSFLIFKDENLTFLIFK